MIKVMEDVTLRELIEERQGRVERLLGKIRHQQQALSQLERDLGGVRAELDVLLGIQRQRDGPGDADEAQDRLPGTAQSGDDTGSLVLKMDRASAAEHVLQVATRGLSPTEVHERLVSLGRTDSYEAVNAALAHLKRTGRAHTPERSRWFAGAGPEPGPGEEEGR